MPGQYKRRNYFIKKKLQARYIFSYFVFVVLGSVFFSIIFALLSANSLTIGFDDHVVQMGRTPTVLLRYIINSQWIFILVGGLVVVIVSLFLTHRFAGPIYRFEKAMEDMIRGDFSAAIHLRKKDEGRDLADKINLLMETMSKTLRDMRDMSDKMDGSLKGLPASPADLPSWEKVRGVLGEVTSLNERLRAQLGTFTLKEP